MLSIKLSLACVIGTLISTTAEAEADRSILDAAFDLPSVQAITIDSTAHELFVAADDRVFRWRLDPFRLTSVTEIDTIVNDIRSGPNGVVYAAGQRWDRATSQLLGGSAVGFAKVAGADDLAKFEVYKIASRDEILAQLPPAAAGYANVSVQGVTQFSSIAFDLEGKMLLASASDYAVTVFQDVDGPISKETNIAQFKLRCGKSVGISVSNIGDSLYYFSSVSEGGLLEIGTFPGESGKAARGECISVADPFGEGASATSYDPVSHAVLDLKPDGNLETVDKALLVLDPDGGQIHLYRLIDLGGKLSILRIESQSLELREHAFRAERDATYTMLAAARDGSEIYVASPASRGVLRFGLDGGVLRSRGRFLMPLPVRRVTISDDGEFSAIVVGEDFLGGDQQITVVANPANLPAGSGIPIELQNVRFLQEALLAEGVRVGAPDGIFGPRTRSAVTNYLMVLDPNSKDIDTDLLGMIESILPMEVAKWRSGNLNKGG